MVDARWMYCEVIFVQVKFRYLHDCQSQTNKIHFKNDPSLVSQKKKYQNGLPVHVCFGFNNDDFPYIFVVK